MSGALRLARCAGLDHRGVRCALAVRAALALDATRRLAREGARVSGLLGDGARHVQDRSSAPGKRLRLIGRTVGRRLGRAGGAREQVLRLTGESGQLIARSIREARRLAAQARAKARGRGARRKLAAAQRLERQADLAETVARQITQRLAGEKITDRMVSWLAPTRGRSARASSASAMSSATSSNSPS